MVDNLLYQPPKISSYHVNLEATFKPNEYFWLQTKNYNKIPGFLIDNSSTSNIYLLVAHGNAEDIGLIRNWFTHLANRLNVSILLFEYTGYYTNDTIFKNYTPSESNVYADIEAAYSFLINDLNIKPCNIILFGRSLGSAAVSHLAFIESKKYNHQNNNADDIIKGIILQSAFMSCFRIAFNFRFTLPFDRFCTIDKIEKFSLKSKCLVIFGELDEIVPVMHGHQLYKALNRKYIKSHDSFFIKNAYHNDIEYKTGEEYFNRLNNYIDALFPERLIH